MVAFDDFPECKRRGDGLWARWSPRVVVTTRTGRNSCVRGSRGTSAAMCPRLILSFPRRMREGCSASLRRCS